MNLSLRNDEAGHRYELVTDTDQVLGHVSYRISNGTIDLYHTEIDPTERGKGLGEILVTHVLDDVRDIGGLRVIPTCPFVADVIERHPEYQWLLGGDG